MAHQSPRVRSGRRPAAGPIIQVVASENEFEDLLGGCPPKRPATVRYKLVRSLIQTRRFMGWRLEEHAFFETNPATDGSVRRYIGLDFAYADPLRHHRGLCRSDGRRIQRPV